MKSTQKKLIVIGFDSISLDTLKDFVQRGVMPTVGKLIEEGSCTQTWPCFPMETATNWACLATGASPWITGCNMGLHVSGKPLNRSIRGFPSTLCKAEQLWTTVKNRGKKAVIFDWTQSYPLSDEENIIHVGEDGRPSNALKAVQEVKAYINEPPKSEHVKEIEPRPAEGWSESFENALEFEVKIDPGPESIYDDVDSLYALVTGNESGYNRIHIYASKDAEEPLISCSEGEWTEWIEHDFKVDGEFITANLRAKLLELSPDGEKIHLYLSEIYPSYGFVRPSSLAEELVENCGPFVIQCSRQQIVQGGASDIYTYFEEQHYLADWLTKAGKYVLGNYDWDLFMLKWHGPDWTNHLAMHLIDSRHPMYDEERAEEGQALWDELMAKGDKMVAEIMEEAGPDTLVALVSDHGGDTQLPGAVSRKNTNEILHEQGWLKYGDDGDVDWSKTKAYGKGPYVFVNLKGRDPQGTVTPGEEYDELREEIKKALLNAVNDRGEPAFQAVMTREKAGRLGVGGDHTGDLFVIPYDPIEKKAMSKEEFKKAYTLEERGTWDQPRLNTGSHTEDSYFVLSGPGIKKDYERPRPTLITSVAPTLATAMGVPVPKDADGSVLWDFFE